jgi:hypothetical protein
MHALNRNHLNHAIDVIISAHASLYQHTDNHTDSAAHRGSTVPRTGDVRWPEDEHDTTLMAPRKADDPKEDASSACGTGSPVLVRKIPYGAKWEERDDAQREFLKSAALYSCSRSSDYGMTACLCMLKCVHE